MNIKHIPLDELRAMHAEQVARYFEELYAEIAQLLIRPVAIPLGDSTAFLCPVCGEYFIYSLNDAHVCEMDSRTDGGDSL